MFNVKFYKLMKKMYSLMLLGVLTFFGASNVWADTYTVVGSSHLTGSDWDVNSTTNEMTLSDGVYVWEVTAVTLYTGETSNAFKVVKNHSYNGDGGGAWPSSNWNIVVDTKRKYDVKITFDPSADNGNGEVTNVRYRPSIIKIASDKTETAWDTGQAWELTTKSSDYSKCSVKHSFDAGDNPLFKMLMEAVGNDDVEYFDWFGYSEGTTITRSEDGNTYEVYTNNAQNITLTTDIGGEYEFVYTYGRGLQVNFPANTYSRDGLTENYYGTICLPYASSSYSGMTLYTIAGKVSGGIALTQVEGQMAAGTPYVFRATASTISVTYTGNPGDVQSATGLVGNLDEDEKTVPANDDNYILTTSGLRKVVGGTVKVAKNRAYFHGLASLDEVTLAPGMRILSIEEDATSLENLAEDGTNTEIYDLLGRRITTIPATGFYIVNGEKKYIVK